MPRPPNFHGRDIRPRRSVVDQKLVSKNADWEELQVRKMQSIKSDTKRAVCTGNKDELMSKAIENDTFTCNSGYVKVHINPPNK